FYSSAYLRVLHSFPTRRSSDLIRRGLGRVSFRPTALTRAHRRRGRHSGRTTSADRSAARGPVDFIWGVLVRTACRSRQLPLCCRDRKSTRLNSSHVSSSYAVFC